MEKPADIVEWSHSQESGNPDVFFARLAESLQWREGFLTSQQVGSLLGLAKTAVAGLPVKRYAPFIRTKRGRRQVTRYHIDDLLQWLAALNPRYADYSPAEGPLLTPAQVANVCNDAGITADALAEMRRNDSGPDFLQVNSRIFRYRKSDVLRWIAGGERSLPPSEMLFDGEPS